MNIDDRLGRLKEREEALRKEIEVPTADIDKLAAAAEAQRISIQTFG